MSHRTVLHLCVFPTAIEPHEASTVFWRESIDDPHGCNVDYGEPIYHRPRQSTNQPKCTPRPVRNDVDEEMSQTMTIADPRQQSDSTTTDANADLEVDHAAMDEPRGKWQAAEEKAAQAENQLTLVVERLEENAERRSANEAALQAAVDQQAELKQAIKTSAEQRETLRKARSKAQRQAEEARKRAQAAEAKYDEALLAEVLAAQKNKDLAASDGQAQAVHDDVVAASIAQSTAQTTAAAVTARNAGA